MKLQPIFVFFCLLGLVCVIGCKDDTPSQPEPEVPTVPKGHNPENPAQTGNPKTPPKDESKVLQNGPFNLDVAGVTFAIPKGWQQTELTTRQQGLGFYVARVLIPGEDSNSELTFSVVGGGQQANVGRWQGQYVVTAPVVEAINTPAGKVTWVELLGDLKPGAPTPAGNTRMIGAAISTPNKGDLYLKLIGQPKALEAIRDDFRKFVESTR